MTQIGFYVLQEDGDSAALTVACRLAGKAYENRLRVYINAPDANTQNRLNDTLWTFAPDSFVPHALAAEDITAPVLIGSGEPPPGVDGALINLSLEVPDFFSRFQRLLELVPPDQEHRNLARKRYRFYQDRGYELKTHKIPR